MTHAFAINDIVTCTHPHTGNTHTGVIVQLYGNGRYVGQVGRQWAHRPRMYRPNPKGLKKLR